MNATISMDGLWTAIQSLSLRNKKWLAEKLANDLQEHSATKSNNEILAGIERGLRDVKEGRVHPIDELWDKL